MPASQFFEGTVMDLLFSAHGSPYTSKATYYLGLSTQAVSGSTDAQILAAEAGGTPFITGGYARVAVTNNTTNWPLINGGTYTGSQTQPVTKTLSATFTFPTSTAAWVSGTTAIQTVFIADSATAGAGNLYWYSSVNPTTQTVSSSLITLQFASGSIQLTLL